MIGDSPLEEWVRMGDPVVSEPYVHLLDRQDQIWQRVEARHHLERVPRVRLRNRRALLSAVVAASIVTTALVLFPIRGIDSKSASSELDHYAKLSENSLRISKLNPGQYYYQRVISTISCTFQISRTVKVDYLVDEAITTWTRPGARSLIVSKIVNSASSNTGWRTSKDRGLWLKAGKPPNPCLRGESAIALSEQSNRPVTVTYSGVGISTLDLRPRTSYIASSNIYKFNRESTITRMLAEGKINPDGSLNSAPHECPIPNPRGYVPTSQMRCGLASQLKILFQLLRIPVLSRTLGGVLCRVFASFPGVIQIDSNVPSLDQSRAAFEDTKTGLVIVVSRKSGQLLQALSLHSSASQNGSDTPLKNARVEMTSFGRISVVSKLETPRK